MSLVHSRAQAAALSARMRAGPGAPAAAGTNRFLLRNSRGPVLDFTYGRYGDRIVVGDRDGNGTWTPGVLRGGRRWYLKNSFTGGAAAVGLAKQTPGTPVVGDWDNRP
jgi:hypothetical protein